MKEITILQIIFSYIKTEIIVQMYVKYPKLTTPKMSGGMAAKTSGRRMTEVASAYAISCNTTINYLPVGAQLHPELFLSGVLLPITCAGPLTQSSPNVVWKTS